MPYVNGKWQAPTAEEASKDMNAYKDRYSGGLSGWGWLNSADKVNYDLNQAQKEAANLASQQQAAQQAMRQALESEIAAEEKRLEARQAEGLDAPEHFQVAHRREEALKAIHTVVESPHLRPKPYDTSSIPLNI